MLLRLPSETSLIGSWPGFREHYAPTSAAPFGMSRGSARWKAAMRLYLRDQVQEARELVETEGLGDAGAFMDTWAAVNAEALTGLNSSVFTVSDWLEVEAVEAELPCPLAQLASIAEGSLRSAFGIFGLQEAPRTLVTVLSKDAMPPSPYTDLGYVVLKSGLGKICVSPDAANNPPDIERAIAAIGSCYTAAVISHSGAAPWLLAASMAAGPERVPSETRKAFCAGELPWLKPGSLSARLCGLGSEDEQMPSFRVARHQALLIGGQLIDRLGQEGLRRLLAYHAPRSAIDGIRLIFAGNPTNAACKKYYGYAQEKVFEDALAVACA